MFSIKACLLLSQMPVVPERSNQEVIDRVRSITKYVKFIVTDNSDFLADEWQVKYSELAS